MGKMASPPIKGKPVVREFKADHPFGYMITYNAIEKPEKTILFTGSLWKL